MQLVNKASVFNQALAGVIALGLTVAASAIVKADEGGVSFWIPGLFGSLAAAPLQPGWSLTTIYYHTPVSAGSDVALAREFSTGRVPLGLTPNLTGTLNATADLAFVNRVRITSLPYA